MSRISLFPRQSRLSRAVRGALAILALGTAVSAWAADAGELPASAPGGPAPLNVTVQPGQSLNDLAKAATQSHDRPCSRAPAVRCSTPIRRRS
ncbi:hypothetical protein [Burkholderia ambifaria]|uniref:hypothetical protein n=1 Tax=Burkholderia ambifaria TaxID=152480 RepID=UPI001F36340C|nr:hypothetical protein [Burkholderia ambifaria]